MFDRALAVVESACTNCHEAHDAAEQVLFDHLLRSDTRHAVIRDDAMSNLPAQSLE